MSVCCFEIHSSIVSERSICYVDPREVGGANMRTCSRIALFKINSDPVEVFSNSAMSSLWKAVPRSVRTTSGVQKCPKCCSMQDADSSAVVVLVGNISTHLEKASMRTTMNSLLCASAVRRDSMRRRLRGE
jgi:hypothetical protein